ncbi:MAG: ATP-binding protein [Phycisphaerae bacterium]|nr:ATP-binding protein [Phycisphaerae bacterium]
MQDSFYDELKRYVGFGDDDAANLRKLGKALKPGLGRITDHFYERLIADADAAAILEESGVGKDQFKPALCRWMEHLFTGQYDDAHFERVAGIGRSHVRVHLPQQYMIIAMNVVRTELSKAVYALGLPNSAEAGLSLSKVLDLELAVMLDSYREEYSQKVRQAERQRMKQRLEEVSHLANVGELAASLAHEIKNPLAGISGAIQVIGTALDPEDPHREIISEILSQIDRLDRTVRDLLVYARPKPPSRTRKNLANVIQRTLKFLRQEPALRDLPIRCRGVERPIYAAIDESQVEQVISNLVLNASHACERGGEVSIALSADRRQVCIEVRDTGQGMTRDSLQRAFEPFFTTKAKGTGLGLAICKRIVEAHEGQMTISSTEGKGTRVCIQLPK